VALNDLDRPNPFEALEMVPVVKNLADLPNVIYLLSYNEVWFDHLIGEIIRRMFIVSGRYISISVSLL
jgi:hypothetical protein